jgi:hypothetical protein
MAVSSCHDIPVPLAKSIPFSWPRATTQSTEAPPDNCNPTSELHKHYEGLSLSTNVSQ